MIREVVRWPDKTLRLASHEIKSFNKEELTAISNDLSDTMYFNNGVGISAIQIGIPVRVLALDVGLGLELYINPKIEGFSGQLRKVSEGCLSFPGIFEDVERHEYINGTAFDINGKQFEFGPGIDVGSLKQNLLRYQCLAHEIEHLDGKILVDNLSITKREIVRSKLKKL